MTIGIIIPARLESTRLQRKMLLDCKGKTLIQRTYENASKAGYPVFVATDSPEIVSTVGIEKSVVVDRAKTGSDRIALANRVLNFNYVINVQGDHPDIPSEVIQNLARSIKSDDFGIHTIDNKMEFVHYVSGTYTRDPIYKHIGIYGFNKLSLESFHTTPQSNDEIKYSLEQLRGLPIIRSVVTLTKKIHSIDTCDDYLSYIDTL